MLREFEGMVGPDGLCLFRPRTDYGGRVSLRPEWLRIPIWAVLDARTAQLILHEQLLGSPTRALRMLEENAISIGLMNVGQESSDGADGRSRKRTKGNRKKPTLRLVTWASKKG